MVVSGILAMLAWTPVGAAAPEAPTWVQVGDVDGCRTFRAPVERDGTLPVRAECVFAVDSARLYAILAEVAAQPRYFTAVRESRAVAPGRYFQVHAPPGLAEREVVIDVTVEPTARGGRVAWTVSPDRSALTGARVAVVRDDEEWIVSDLGDGKSRLVYELRYLPGGWVPRALVALFQAEGVMAVLRELRAEAMK